MKKYNKKLAWTLLMCCIAFICCISIPTARQKVYAATKIQLNKKSITLTKGESTTLKLKGTTKKAKWTTSNKKIATVNQKGKVVAKKTGKAKITAKIAKKKYTCNVTVVESQTSEQPTPEWGDSGEDWKYSVEDDNTITIKGYQGKDVNIIIPSSIRGILVTTIGHAAFE